MRIGGGLVVIGAARGWSGIARGKELLREVALYVMRCVTAVGGGCLQGTEERLLRG